MIGVVALFVALWTNAKARQPGRRAAWTFARRAGDSEALSVSPETYATTLEVLNVSSRVLRRYGESGRTVFPEVVAVPTAGGAPLTPAATWEAFLPLVRFNMLTAAPVWLNKVRSHLSGRRETPEIAAIRRSVQEVLDHLCVPVSSAWAPDGAWAQRQPSPDGGLDEWQVMAWEEWTTELKRRSKPLDEYFAKYIRDEVVEQAWATLGKQSPYWVCSIGSMHPGEAVFATGKKVDSTVRAYLEDANSWTFDPNGPAQPNLPQTSMSSAEIEAHVKIVQDRRSELLDELLLAAALDEDLEAVMSHALTRTQAGGIAMIVGDSGEVDWRPKEAIPEDDWAL